MIEVSLKISKQAIKETLNRIGIANNTQMVLFPSVYLYENEINGEKKTFLIHFKEYFQITRPSAYNNTSTEDTDRLGYIAGLLKQWNMLDCNDKDIVKECKNVKVLSKVISKEWTIKHKIKF